MRRPAARRRETLTARPRPSAGWRWSDTTSRPLYQVTDPGIRQMFIDYLTRRDADLDSTSRWNLAPVLVGIFWQEVQRIAPGQTDLRLSPEVYEQWRATVRFHRNGVTVRKDDLRILLAVRAMYLDIQTWAMEEPQTWGRWAVPCPIPPSELRGVGRRRRRAAERMADRIRQRQPLLPALVRHVEDLYTEVGDLLEAARAVSLGEQFNHEGESAWHPRTTGTCAIRLSGPVDKD